MASAIYPKFKEACLSGGSNTNLITGDVRLILVDTGTYTYADTHEFLTSVPAGARVSTTTALTGKSATNGNFDCADTSFPATAAGTTAEAIVLYVHTGTDATARLVAYFDNTSGLPITTNNQPIAFTVDPAGLFQL